MPATRPQAAALVVGPEQPSVLVGSLGPSRVATVPPLSSNPLAAKRAPDRVAAEVPATTQVAVVRAERAVATAAVAAVLGLERTGRRAVLAVLAGLLLW